MKTSTLLTALAVAFVLPAHPAKAAVGDPMQNLYVFPGARDDGSTPSAGIATAVGCHSFSSVTEKVRWIALNFDGNRPATGDVSFNVGANQTRTMTTHHVNFYVEDVNMATPTSPFNGPTLDQGTIYVFATSANIVCTANIVNAASATPQGIDLHGLRSSPPFPGSQE